MVDPTATIFGPETSEFDDGLQLYYELMPIDPGIGYALQRPDGGNFRFSQTGKALTPRPDDWREGIRHGVGSGDYHSRFSAQIDGLSLVLSMHTPADTPALTGRQEALHALAFAHMERAARLAHQARRGAVRNPHIAVDATGRVLDVNDAALALLGRQSGLVIRENRLAATDIQTDRRLSRAINEICRIAEYGATGRFVRVCNPSGGSMLILKLQPLPVEFIAISTALFRCSIEIMQPAATSVVAPEMLREVFGLSAREAEVASLFGGICNDLPAAARRLGISHETARVHMRAILEKCEVANQVELARLLSSLN